jgi:IS1 family transposase
MLKKFLVQIWAYDHYAKFKVLADDNAESIEKAVLDKIGEKSIKWEDLGNSYRDQRRITYEEVIDGTRTVQTKTVLGVEVAVGV